MVVQKRKKRKRLYLILLMVLCVVSYYVFYLLGEHFFWEPARQTAKRENAHEVLTLVSASLEENLFPDNFNVTYQGAKVDLDVKYTVYDPLQSKMEGLIKSYKPDFSSFVAMDVHTGKILSLVNFVKDKEESYGNLAFRASFPSASVFKVITAAAAMDKYYLVPDSEIIFQGSNTSLYKKNVFDTQKRRWTREMTLKEAFGKSVNTVFGKIGWFFVGYPTLKEYSAKFGFNVKIESEIPMDMSTSEFEDDSWEIASAASGYTRGNKMSPVHAALIASVAANQGKMMSPALIESIYLKDKGEMVYQFEPRVQSHVVSAETAEQLKVLMRETVTSGTSRSIFRTFFKTKKYQGIDVGGKTGSLTGFHPRGRYDWFIGYFTHENRTISVAALTINEKYWTVKSAHLVRKFIEYYVDDFLEKPKELSPDMAPIMRGSASQ